MFNILKINTKAPIFDLKGSQAGNMKQWKTEDFAGKWLVFFFYPADFTFVCPTEVKAFNELLPQFQAKNCEVVGCSVDSPFVHTAWAESLGGIDYPLLSDVHHTTSIDYNVFVDEDAQTLRGTFILNPEGILKWYCISDNNVGRNVDEILRTVDALQTGLLCPANWKKGEKTLN